MTITLKSLFVPLLPIALVIPTATYAVDQEAPARPGLVFSDVPQIRTMTVKAVSFQSMLEQAGAVPPSSGEIDDENETIRVPADPAVDPSTIVPKGAPTEPGTAISPLSSSDFVFYSNRQLSDTDTGDPGGWPREPTVAVFGRSVLYTGNTVGALSGDAAATWQNVNPNALTNVSNVCCDQYALYERRHGALIWLLQGNKDLFYENNYYLAFFNGQRNMSTLTGSAYPLDPQDFGFLPGTWWDFPDLAVSNNYVWFTADAFLGSTGTGMSIIVRASLDDFLDGGTTTFDSAILSAWAVRLIQAADTSVMYGAAHVDNNTMRIYRWPEGGSLDSIDRDVDAWSNGGNVVDLPGGGSWLGDSSPCDDGHSPSAAVATPTHIYFMWTASQGGGYPYPQVQIAQFTRDSNRDYVQTQVVWSTSFAWAFPSGSTNDRGHLGGTIAFGGGTRYPSTAAWIADDYNGIDLQPLESVTIASGNYAYSGGGRWGDYLSARRHVPYFNTWVGTGFTMEDGTSSNDDICTYTWFGRERDRPPTTNTIYVDATNTSGWESGNDTHPFSTVDEGAFATMPGDIVIVQAGTYTEHITLDRACRVMTQGGSTIIQ